MEDFAGPSFSLGLDLDVDVPSSQVAAAAAQKEEEEARAVAASVETPSVSVDDDIEQFSSDDDEISKQNERTPVSSSTLLKRNTKLSLSGRRAVPSVASQSPERSSALTAIFSNIQVPCALKPALENQVSPVGNIQQPQKLFGTVELSNQKGKNDAFKATSVDSGNHLCKGKASYFLDVSQGDRLETPAFDEFCDEYFRSSVRPDPHTSVESQSHSIGESAAPATFYFTSDDSRIRCLVRQQLAHFLPISCLMQGENQDRESVHIEYLNQFASRQDQDFVSAVESQSNGCTMKRSASKRLGNGKLNVPDSIQTGGWTNTAHRLRKSAVPRDAGKRRVVANSEQKGTWITDEHGRKIYRTKSGQALSGRTAYASYKRENKLLVRKHQKKKKKRRPAKRK